MLKKISKGVPLKKKFQLKNENEKYWKLPDLARKVEKKWSKNLTAAAGEKKKSKKYKKLDNYTKWRDLKFYGARTNGLEDIQVRN